MPDTANDRRRQLPAVDRLLREPRVEALKSLYGSDLVTAQARAALAALRDQLGDAPGASGELAERLAELPERLARELGERFGTPLARTLNATGIFLHTNLGRAPLPRPVALGLGELAVAACDLEIDLASGRRGDRARRVEELLRAATGAEAALAVNNNAAALLLALTTLAAGREVVVSRGELVEIGGSFRVPDLLAAGGARLREVGTTNRTRLADYARAIGPETALLLKVHPSNYRISGFVAAVEAPALADLAHRHGLPLLVDEGAGLLAPHPAPQLAGHPSVAELLAGGADLVASSGDKLLGGPQAGLLVGRRELVARCAEHPLYRALRPGRLVSVALDALLRYRLAGGPLPLDRLWPDPAAHRARLERLAVRLGAEIRPADAFVGGGAAPDAPVPGEALALDGGDELARRLRTGRPPVVGVVREGRLWLDLRTVDPADDDELAAAVEAARATPAARVGG